MLAISKQQSCQKYIYKIHSSRLREARWNLVLPIEEARKNDEVISLADSQVLRWIDELNGVTDADIKARQIKCRIKFLKRQENSLHNRHEIKRLYSELDELQFKPDYMSLVIDKPKDYIRACKGYKINGVKYKRLLGTNGGIKNSTIVFVSERLSDELRRRIENGRNPDMPLVTAKLEAYKALSCSASIPVSTPNGILVVDDVYTEFFADVVNLTDECEGEPQMTPSNGEKIEMDASDGYGLMLPSLAERWSEELDLGYTASCVNTRFAWEKGVACAFDFVEFAREVAHNYIVKDAWGNDVDVRSVELVLTTSMVKLWDSYDSCEHYVQESLKNGYSFGITKTSPRELENERCLNYQFIQSFDLDDDDIEELISPTVNEIKDVLTGDWRKAVLFLKGSGLNEYNVPSLENDFVKAMMVDPRVFDDPWVKSSIYNQIRNRINEAKVGVLKVHGNYSIAVGDPFLLCQSFFGLERTGLLKAGEIYNKFWKDNKTDEVICFRAPMTCHENIMKMGVSNSSDVGHWFQHMSTCTVFNGWDTATAAMNGMD